jgi:hypothetical protein
MLPDFPKVREYTSNLLHESFEQHVAAQTGVMRDIKAVMMHEGHRMKLVRSDGSIEQHPMKKMETTIRLGKDDLEKKGLQAVLEAMNEAAADLAEKQSRFFFQRLEETLEGTGQTCDAGGRPFTFDLMLQALEMVDIDFDEQGNPILPTLVSGRAAWEAAQKWIVTDEQRKQHKELIERKRLAWRERESNRRLVS